MNLLDLCQQGGFVICEGSAELVTRESISEIQFTDSMANLSQNLGVSQSPRPLTPASGETAADHALDPAERARSSK